MGIVVLLRLWGLRQLQRHPLRTGISVVGVAVGVTMLSAVAFINTGITQSFDGLIERVSRGVDLVVGGGGLPVPEATLSAVSTLDLVSHVAGVLEGTLPAPSLGDTLLLLGVDLLGDTHFLSLDGQDAQDDAVLAEPFSFLNSTQHVLLPADYARSHKLARGDTFTVTTPGGTRTLKVFGLLGASGAAQAFGGAVAVMSVDAARMLLGAPDVFTRLDVALKPGHDVENARRVLQAAAGPTLDVGRPKAVGALGNQVSAVFRNGLVMSSFVALLVALGIIANTMRISVLQRRWELGILRATGATRGQVVALVVLEGVVLGALGGGLGAVSGWALARVSLGGAAQLFGSAFVPIRPEGVQLSALQVLGGMALGMVASAFAAAAPAREAGRVSPVSILGRGVAATTTSTRWWLPVLGALVLSAAAGGLTRLVSQASHVLPAAAVAASFTFAAVLLLTPVAMVLLHSVITRGLGARLALVPRLAVDNMARTLSTGSTNVGALAVAVLVVAALGSFVESFAGSLKQWAADNVAGDLVVAQGEDATGLDAVPLDPRLTALVAAQPGVDKVVGVRVVNLPWQDTVLKLRSVPAEDWLARTHPMVLQGAPLTGASLRNGVAVSESLVTRLGVKLGDALQLPTPDGVKTVRVVAVMVDYGSPVGTITLDATLFQAWWKDELQDALQVFVTPGADVEAVRRAIVQATQSQARLMVASNAEYRGQVDDTVARFFYLTRLLILIAMVVAVLGLINTLQANVLDRTRELGVMRATGATRAQVQQLVIIEALCMALVALVLGTAGGLATGAGMIETLMRAQTGWHLPAVVPWSTLAFNTVLTLVASGLAAWWPARRASRLSVTSALA